ncbi:HERC2 [Symbiodinium necroappetens]|uniref:HERC2 protein n=1 Tax=Symbiodinium necroappetens TaxID=1628268 RepID=A0A812XHD3_9DINO|nr:HERC2 [Symbiodinium sp. KB8]CAE7724543.1 HERC2 [Symbiodinium necroappetens]
MGAELSSPGPTLESVLEGVGPDMRGKLSTHLESMSSRNLRFRHVAIWRDPFLGGTIDHHTVVYEYLDGRRLMSLKLDWGRDGLHFHDSPEDPCPNGDVLERKWCARLTPVEVLLHWDDVKERNYELSRWNCQHFSRYMYDKADEGGVDMVKPS